MKQVALLAVALTLTLALNVPAQAGRGGGGGRAGGGPSPGARGPAGPSFGAGGASNARNLGTPAGNGGGFNQGRINDLPNRNPLNNGDGIINNPYDRGNAINGNGVINNSFDRTNAINEALGRGNLDPAVPGNVLPNPIRNSGNWNPAALQNRQNGAFNRDFNNVRRNYATNGQPFSPEWYANHPQAWQATHPHADAWAVAGLAATTAWLGWDAVPVYGTSYAATDDTATDAEVAEQAAEQANEAEQASTIAQTGDTAVQNNGEWFSLGTFGLAPSGQNDSTAMLQLFVNKDGILRGTYYDILSDSGQEIQGAIDRTTQRAAWTVGASKAVFATTLPELSEGRGGVNVHFENGQTRGWNLQAATATPDTQN